MRSSYCGFIIAEEAGKELGTHLILLKISHNDNGHLICNFIGRDVEWSATSWNE